MTDFFLYLSCSTLALAALYLLYKVLMSYETLHRLNRVLLLGFVVLSAVLPLCRIEVVEELPAVEPVEFVAPMTDSVVYEVAESFNYTALLQMALFALFLLGVVVMIARLVISIMSVKRIIRSGEQQYLEGGVTLTIVDKPISPFSWFGHIVVSRADIEQNRDIILTHEMAHIRLRHSWDVLAVDLALCFWWFNPAMWLLRRELQSLHEYQADEEVLNSGIDAQTYQLLLIKRAVGSRLHSVANCLNHSNLNKRITMMCKKTSSRWSAAKALLVLPLVAMSLAATATTVYVTREVQDKVTENSVNEQPSAVVADQNDKKVCVTGSVVDAKTKKPITNAILILKGESDAIVLNTDKSGNYSFKQVADGSYMLEVSVIGYKKETKKVKVEPNKVATVDFALTEDVVTADEVVVATYADKEKKEKKSKSKGEQEKILVISQQPNENCFHNGEFIGSPRDVEKLSKFLEQYKGNTIKVQLESGCPMISSVLLYMLRNMSMNVIAEYKYDKSSRDQNEAEAGIKEFLSEQLRRRLNNVECMTGVVTVNAKVARTGMVSIENMSVVSTNGVGMALAKRVEQSIKQAPFVNVQGLNESLPLTLEVVFAKKGLDGKVETDVAPEKISADAVWVIGEETSLTVEDIVVVEKSDESFDSSVKKSEEDTPFIKVEKMPTFQGGDLNKFRNWVQSKIQYPKEAMDKGIKGRVVCSFVVEKDGSLTEFDVLQSPDKSLADEVVRILKTSPKWEPGEQLGEKVRVKYTVPIVFQIKQ